MYNNSKENKKKSELEGLRVNSIVVFFSGETLVLYSFFNDNCYYIR